MSGRARRPLAAITMLLAAAAPIANIASAETVRIEVKSLAFTPAEITAHVGDTIEWLNDDFVAHTATARNGEWDVKLAPHATGRTVARSSGKVEYYCRYHPNMKGQVTIVPH
jgi:plastocyanin